MKKKLMICFLVFAMVFGSVSAMAAPKIGSANPVAGKAELTVEDGGKSVTVNYNNGEKDQQYVVMVVAEDAIDAASGVPTKDSINNNQNHEVVYMDQVTGGSDGAVLFNVYPDLDHASAGDKFGIFLSGTGLDMSKIGEFTTIADILRWLGDLNGDDDINIQDVMKLLNICINNTQLEGDDFKVANVKSDDNDINIQDVMRLLNMVIQNADKVSIG